MTILTQELLDFTSFAEQEISRGFSDTSLEDVFRLWREQRGRSSSIEAIREGFEDIHAGRTRPADAVISEIRGRLASRKTSE